MKDKYSVIYKPAGAALEYSPMAVNLYTGCPNGCKYCFVPDVLHKDRPTYHETWNPRNGIIRHIKSDLDEMKAAGDKRMVLLCFTCDPYPEPMGGNEVTRSALLLFNHYEHPFQVLTKGGQKARRDFELYSDRDSFGTTLTLFDQAESLKWEPKAAAPWDRMETLKAAKRAGIKTWVSFEPVIDPLQTYALYDMTRDYVDLYKVGKLNYLDIGIDWKRFAGKMISMMEADGKEYIIKDALKKYL